MDWIIRINRECVPISDKNLKEMEIDYLNNNYWLNEVVDPSE